MPDKSSFKGMTVNERLYEIGALDEFDQAVRLRNRAGLIEILARVDLGDEAEDIADKVLARAL